MHTLNIYALDNNAVFSSYSNSLSLSTLGNFLATDDVDDVHEIIELIYSNKNEYLGMNATDFKTEQNQVVIHHFYLQFQPFITTKEHMLTILHRWEQFLKSSYKELIITEDEGKFSFEMKN